MNRRTAATCQHVRNKECLHPWDAITNGTKTINICITHHCLECDSDHVIFMMGTRIVGICGHEHKFPSPSELFPEVEA